MISSRARSIFPALSIILFAISIYFCWAVSSETIAEPSLRVNAVAGAVTSLNLAIIFGWMGFGITGGVVLTVCAFLFVGLLGFRMSYYGYNIFALTFPATAWTGYLFAKARNRLDQLYLLKSEKVGEDINLLANEVKEKNKGIKAFEEKMMRYSVLKEIAESLSAVLSREDIATTIIEKTLKTIAKSGRVLLFMVDAERQELMLLASSTKDRPIVKTKKGDVFDVWVLRHRKSLMIEDVGKDFRFPIDGIKDSSGVFRSMIASPLVSEDKVMGVLRMDSQHENAYTQDDMRLLNIIASLGAVALQNYVLYSRTQELAIRDGLTGLKVRRFFMESLHREVKRASRKKEQISLLMLDIDHFKDYNDEYGHASGDLVLKYLAETLRVILEEADVAGRYGGEEIAILLWGKGKKEAHLQAEKIRQMVKERSLTLREHAANVTVSIGVSTYPEDAASEEEMIRVADARLYKAKAEGRDRVCSV